MGRRLSRAARWGGVGDNLPVTTSPHGSPPHESGPRRRVPWIFLGVLALALVPAALFFRDDLPAVGGEEPQVSGRVLWSTEDLAIQLGPGGWVTHPGEGGEYVATNVRTDESWAVGEMSSQREITPKGVIVQDVEGQVVIQRDGSRLTTGAQDIVEAFGDEDLWPGEDVVPVGVSVEHVAVLTCLAPAPAGLLDEVEGGRQVLAGVDLGDASVAWTHDTGVACGPARTPAYYPQTLPEQQYLLVETADDARHAIDLDTGAVARRWAGARRGDVTVHGDHVLEPADGKDAVAYRSLATGEVVARVECEGARAGDPQHISRQLAPEVTPFVDCRDGVRLVDDGEVVDTGAAPVSGVDRVLGTEPVALGRTVLRRSGDGVQLSDGLTDEVIATLAVPEDFEVGRFGPVGRLVGFVRIDSGGERPTGDYRVFDSTTGELVLSAGPGMTTGADLAPSGELLVDLDEAAVEDGAPRAWVAGAREAS